MLYFLSEATCILAFLILPKPIVKKTNKHLLIQISTSCRSLTLRCQCASEILPLRCSHGNCCHVISTYTTPTKHACGSTFAKNSCVTLIDSNDIEFKILHKYSGITVTNQNQNTTFITLFRQECSVLVFISYMFSYNHIVSSCLLKVIIF